MFPVTVWIKVHFSLVSYTVCSHLPAQNRRNIDTAISDKVQSSWPKTLKMSEVSLSVLFMQTHMIFGNSDIKITVQCFYLLVCPMLEQRNVINFMECTHMHACTTPHTHSCAHTKKSSACQQLWWSKMQMIIRNTCPQQRGTETKRSSFSK